MRRSHESRESSPDKDKKKKSTTEEEKDDSRNEEVRVDIPANPIDSEDSSVQQLYAHGVDDMFHERMDDPERIAEYRRMVEERGLDPDVFQERLQEKVKIMKKFQYFIQTFLIFSIVELMTYIQEPLADFHRGIKVFWVCSAIMCGISFLCAIGVNTITGNIIRMHMGFHILWIILDIYFLVASGLKLMPFEKAFERGDWVYLAVWVCFDIVLRVGRCVGSYMYLKYYDMLNFKEQRQAYRTLPCCMCMESLQQGGIQGEGEA